jgi:oligopeptidase B
MWLGPNREHATDTIRFECTSLTQPRTSVDHDVTSGRRTVVKRDEVLGGYDPERYESVRLEATAPDGVRVPISLVRPHDAERPGPMLLYGYGAYETSIDPAFSYSRLSLLERGIAFATAHVRGGGELGRAWYDDGKLERKANTFTDFIACAEHVIANGYTTPGCLVANGRSAGGLLAGAIANMRPDLFRAIVAEVPFVDAITTMQDPSLPLTVTEWDEWGDPRDPAIYRAIRAYSPYDNVTEQEYPAILATAGLSDSRVQYWEPAKWVLKLRDHTTSGEPVLLKVEMAAGHAGPSGRYESWRDDAFVLAFVIGVLGLA